MPITFNAKCKKCGTTLRRQLLMAMMVDAGAQTSNPSECSEGGDHDFNECDLLDEGEQ